MIEFQNISLADKPWIDACVKQENSRSADFNFANMYMWDEAYKQLVAHVGERMVAKPKYRAHPFFAFPIGGGDLKSAIEALKDYAAEREFPFCIQGVTAEHREELESLFPGTLAFVPDRAHFDYVYEAERLATLGGKKLHAKRNHINRFLEEHGDWRVLPLTEAMLPECRSMLEQWTAAYNEEDALREGIANEHTAIERAFAHFDTLGLEGAALYTGERMIAFTVGEKISSDTYDVHFEKAFSDIQGAYPMINREFVRMILEKHPEIRYINREDDMGLEGLRKAKLSYDPAFLVEKFSVCLCNCGENVL